MYSNNKHSEKKIKETFLFTITSKRLKYLVIDLTKGVKTFHSKTFKSRKTEIGGDTGGWKDPHPMLMDS